MTRGRLAAGAVAALAAAALAVGAYFVVGWWHGDGGSYAPRRLVARASVTPKRSLFGQVVTATVQVLVDPRRVDPRSVAVSGRFTPFQLRAETDSTTRVGRAELLSVHYALQCTVAACVPRGPKGRGLGGATAFTFRPARVVAQGRDGRTIRATAAWPTFGVQSRLTAQELALAEPRIDNPLAAPAVTWRVRPVVLGAAASVLAGLLALGAALLVGSVALADGRPLRVLRIPANLTPVERALRLAEHAARKGETDESRKALERLAVELRRRGAPVHAADAERLAWSEDRPTAETVAELATAVRSNGAR
ncbi:MAG TPA: hypothetical protein VHC67_04390 [Gaiellaceae bacterium]|nr:hypothetical protein [Gaiellaceae bacterium]